MPAPTLRTAISRAARATTVVVPAVTLAVPSLALAHIDPDPTEAQAGSVQSVGFTVEHGCDGSPTVQLDMRLPAGVTGASAEPPAGWTGVVEGDVVTFAGGPLPDDVEETFRVRMTLPATPDVTIYFPFVQRCEVGEIRWIDVPTDGSGATLDEPAPAMRLVGPVATTVAPETTTTTPPGTVSTAPTTSLPTTAASGSTVGDTSTTVSTEPPAVTVAAGEEQGGGDDDGGPPAGLIVAVVAVALAAVAGAITVAARRRGGPVAP